MNKKIIRKNSRVPFKTAITMRFADRSYEHRETSDLSLKGVSVIGVTGHRVGEQCAVELHLSGSDSNVSLKMQGEVVRVGPSGLALHLFAIDLDSFSHLKNIIAYNLDDPDQVDKEFLHQLKTGKTNDLDR